MPAIAAEEDLLPFEIHRVVEYLLGLGLISFYVNDAGRHPVLGGAGLVVLALAATTRGRLGALRWWPLGLHRVLDVVVIVAMAAVPFVPGAGGLMAGLYLVPTAAVLAGLTRHTRYRPPTPTITTTPDRTPTPQKAEPGLAAAESPPANPAAGRMTDPHAGGSRPPWAGQGLGIKARKLGYLAGRLAAAARQGPVEHSGDQQRRSSTDDTT